MYVLSVVMYLRFIMSVCQFISEVRKLYVQIVSTEQESCCKFY